MNFSAETSSCTIIIPRSKIGDLGIARLREFDLSRSQTESRQKTDRKGLGPALLTKEIGKQGAFRFPSISAKIDSPCRPWGFFMCCARHILSYKVSWPLVVGQQSRCCLPRKGGREEVNAGQSKGRLMTNALGVSASRCFAPSTATTVTKDLLRKIRRYQGNGMCRGIQKS